MSPRSIYGTFSSSHNGWGIATSSNGTVTLDTTVSDGPASVVGRHLGLNIASEAQAEVILYLARVQGEGGEPDFSFSTSERQHRAKTAAYLRRLADAIDAVNSEQNRWEAGYRAVLDHLNNETQEV